jgi:hypothetical protein
VQYYWIKEEEPVKGLVNERRSHTSGDHPFTKVPDKSGKIDSKFHNSHFYTTKFA